MNGKAAKRIRLAARAGHRDVRQLKKEYKALPYHRRTDKPWRFKESHSQLLRMTHNVYYAFSR